MGLSHPLILLPVNIEMDYQELVYTETNAVFVQLS